MAPAGGDVMQRSLSARWLQAQLAGRLATCLVGLGVYGLIRGLGFGGLGSRKPLYYSPQVLPEGLEGRFLSNYESGNLS